MKIMLLVIDDIVLVEMEAKGGDSDGTVGILYFPTVECAKTSVPPKHVKKNYEQVMIDIKQGDVKTDANCSYYQV